MIGPELAVELKRLAGVAETTQEVPKQLRGKLLELGRESSNWQRVKHDGFRALDAQAFLRIDAECKNVGLLINPEGELEGFCREISRNRKSDWLAEAVRRNLGEDMALKDARDFAAQIRAAIQKVMKLPARGTM
jgi:hypothetical protein